MLCSSQWLVFIGVSQCSTAGIVSPQSDSPEFISILLNTQRGFDSVRGLNRSEILRIKAQLLETLARSRELLHNAQRLRQDCRQTVEHSRQLLARTHEVIARAADAARGNTPVAID
jgi:hypothetical protein